MNKAIENYFNFIIQNESNLLNYIKNNYPFFHKSNVFYRDIQFGIKHFLESKNVKISYTESELLADEFIEYLISKNILKKIDYDVFLLNYPDFTVKPNEAIKS